MRRAANWGIHFLINDRFLGPLLRQLHEWSLQQNAWQKLPKTRIAYREAACSMVLRSFGTVTQLARGPAWCLSTGFGCSAHIRSMMGKKTSM